MIGAAAEIAAFLEARIGEEEEIARAATPGPWSWPADELTSPAGTVLASVHYGGVAVAEEDAAHIVRQGPAVTLARCAAMRMLVALHRPVTIDWVDLDGDDRTGVDCDECDNGGVIGSWPCQTIRHLAAFYRLRADGSQHPEWRKEWDE